jgi:hypothetical protein
MIKRKNWEEFRKTGLLLIINQTLHIFGWALVCEIENEVIVSVYPARVKFRGFGEKSTEDAYKKISQYMADNSKELNEEVQS